VPDRLGRVLDALLHSLDDTGLDAVTVADALWLAAGRAARHGATGPGGRPAHEETAVPERPPTPAHPPDRPREQEPPLRSAATPGTARVRSYPLYEELDDEPPALSGPSLSVPAGRALSQTVELGRSLRPFMRRYPRGRKTGLDMQATIDSFARDGELVPVIAPLPEPWFEVVVIVDTHLTTDVWQTAIDEFVNLLENTGAFRQVRRWHLTTDAQSPYLTDARGQFVNVSNVTGSQQRRFYLILSDCAAPAWYEPAVWQLLRQWALRAPLSIASPLPARLWHRTALDLPAVHVRNRVPGASNAALRVTPPAHLPWILQPGEPYVAIPALTLTAHSLQRWAHGFVRGAPEGYEAVLVGPYGNAPSPFLGLSPQPAETETEESETDAARAFLQTAAPAAVRLAALCSSFRRLSLPLLQLIRQEVVREAGNADIAELLTSSLLRIDTSRSGPPLILFTEAARTQLSALVGRHDAWRTYEALSHYIARRTRLPAKSLDAIAALPADGLPEDLRPFAQASQELLTALRKGAAALGPTPQETGEENATGQLTHRWDAFGRPDDDPSTPLLENPHVEEAFARVRSAVWHGGFDGLTSAQRQAADRIAKAFIGFLAESLAEQGDDDTPLEPVAFLAALGQSLARRGVAAEVGVDASFLVRAHVPGPDGNVVVLADLFTFAGRPVARPIVFVDTVTGRSGLRVAPFAIVLFLNREGPTGLESMSDRVRVTPGSPTTVQLRFPR
jgi:hypothetical protein